MNFSVGWAIAAPLTADFAQNVTPPDGYWSISLRPLLLGAITDGRRGAATSALLSPWSGAASIARLCRSLRVLRLLELAASSLRDPTMRSSRA